MKRSQLLYIILGLLFIVSCEKREQHGPPTHKAEVFLKKGDNYNLTPEVREQYLDSAVASLVENRNDSLKRLLLRKAVTSYYNIYNHKKSKETAREVLKLGRISKDSVSIGKSLFYIGEVFFDEDNNDSAISYYREAEKIYSNLEDKRTLGEIILYKAYIYYDIGEYVLSESEAFKALKYLMTENRPTDIYNCYNLIATSLDGQDKNPEAIHYYQLALKELDNYKQEGYADSDIALYKASLYNNLGGVYVKMHQHDKAIDIYRNALKFREIEHAESHYAKLIYTKLLNNMAQAKLKARKTDGLPEMFYKSLAIRDSLDNDQGVVASNISLGEYFLYKRDTAKAIQYLNTAYRGAKKIDSHSDVLTSLKFLSAIDKRNSLKHYSSYINLSDSLQDIAEATRNKFARIEYETDKLEDEKEALAKKNSFIIGVSVVVLLFVAAIFMIYYLNSRNKELLLIQEQQKANEEIYELMFEQQTKVESARAEEKSRIAMELHDGILNNIYAVRLNLEFINKKADDESIQRRKEYIKELQNVESEIRGVSHDLSRNAIFSQEQGFDAMLEFMITAQKNTFDTEFEADVDHSIDWEKMTNVQKVNIYRIIQEALQNINKYSKAGYAKVEVARKDENISITVTDNGVGFDPEKAKGGIGLKNLRKRAEALSGALSVTSKPGKGATVEVIFPT